MDIEHSMALLLLEIIFRIISFPTVIGFPTETVRRTTYTPLTLQRINQ